jgi:hypothetical protein
MFGIFEMSRIKPFLVRAWRQILVFSVITSVETGALEALLGTLGALMAIKDCLVVESCLFTTTEYVCPVTIPDEVGVGRVFSGKNHEKCKMV